MRLRVTAVFVEDQEKALRFYEDVLGFKKHTDIELNGFRWLTVYSEESGREFELLLEKNVDAAGIAYQQSSYQYGKPSNSFAVNNLKEEYERLKKLGVKFTVPPTEAPWGSYAFFDDTCGNLINLAEFKKMPKN